MIQTLPSEARCHRDPGVHSRDCQGFAATLTNLQSSGFFPSSAMRFESAGRNAKADPFSVRRGGRGFRPSACHQSNCVGARARILPPFWGRGWQRANPGAIICTSRAGGRPGLSISFSSPYSPFQRYGSGSARSRNHPSERRSLDKSD